MHRALTARSIVKLDRALNARSIVKLGLKKKILETDWRHSLSHEIGTNFTEEYPSIYSLERALS